MTIKDIITNLNEFAASLPNNVDTNVDMIYVEDATGMNAIVFPNATILFPDMSESHVEVKFDKDKRALCFRAKSGKRIEPIDNESHKLL